MVVIRAILLVIVTAPTADFCPELRYAKGYISESSPLHKQPRQLTPKFWSNSFLINVREDFAKGFKVLVDRLSHLPERIMLR